MSGMSPSVVSACEMYKALSPSLSFAQVMRRACEDHMAPTCNTPSALSESPVQSPHRAMEEKLPLAPEVSQGCSTPLPEAPVVPTWHCVEEEKPQFDACSIGSVSTRSDTDSEERPGSFGGPSGRPQVECLLRHLTPECFWETLAALVQSCAVNEVVAGLVEAAEEANASLLAALSLELHLQLGSPFSQLLQERCCEELPKRRKKARVQGLCAFVAELFLRNCVTMGTVKAAFFESVFAVKVPKVEATVGAAGLLRRTRGLLQQTERGVTMVRYVELRFQEMRAQVASKRNVRRTKKAPCQEAGLYSR